jgi:tankyrase
LWFEEERCHNVQAAIALLVENELFNICSERDSKPADQRKRLVIALKAGADIHATDKNGVTALHHAVRFRSPACVKALIEHGANVNQTCRRNGSTPLHRAVTQTGAPGTAGKGGDAVEIIRLLLAAGADSSIANKSGKKPADYVRTKPLSRCLRKMMRSLDPHSTIGAVFPVQPADTVSTISKS